MEQHLESPRSWYASSIGDFLLSPVENVLGKLSLHNQFDLAQDQRDAWVNQCQILQRALVGFSGAIFLEYSIPRMGRRIDVVLLIRQIIFVVEFKVGKDSFDKYAVDQVWDYALDLKNFHEASHARIIAPILLATNASLVSLRSVELDADNVIKPVLASIHSFREILDSIVNQFAGETLDPQNWASSRYRPTPTIIEAARALYGRHSVEDIARSDAGAVNLALTSGRVEEIAAEAKALGRKSICFVTGVPGAGKTLVGLNIANRGKGNDDGSHAVFLSGNGPLVSVLCEALTRDEVARQKSIGIKARKSDVGQGVKTFIQNVHHFRDDKLADDKAPFEHVVIFDEAQRAWNLKKTADFMQRKRNQAGFSQTEPEFLMSCMDRHDDWAVIICLVGGGQEINEGEAGIEAWIDAAKEKFPEWHVYISSRLLDTEYAAGMAVESIRTNSNTHFEDNLHLSVSMRSFRAEKVSSFIKAVLDCDHGHASEILSHSLSLFPIVITRDIQKAKKWVRTKARGTERFGILASSKAMRLKPHAIDIRVIVDPIHWFLNGKEDTRSSYYLEDAATEFQVQGLELDWACVTWDGDLRFDGSRWRFHDFRGDRWTKIHITENQKYLLNAYRVLLTRARQGMVVYVPFGDQEDPTRSPEFYDGTFDFLKSVGIPEIA